MRFRFFLSVIVFSISTGIADDLSVASPAVRADTSNPARNEPVELPARSAETAGARLREDRTAGDYGQPEWSSRRLFSEVRTYVIPKGRFEFEYWLFLDAPSRDETDAASKSGAAEPKWRVKQVYEAEMGLGYRFQLDLYQVFRKEGSDGKNALDATKFELRYALADWDVLWGNPTFYAEWEQAAEGDDAAEGKLLFCGSVSDRWRWASNLVWEEVTGGSRERSLEWNSAVSYAAKDEKLSLGLEVNLADVSELVAPDADTRDHHAEIAAGPSLRFNPVAQAHIILSEFIGLNGDAHAARSVGIIGWEF